MGCRLHRSDDTEETETLAKDDTTNQSTEEVMKILKR
jgi:hypothetical protein